MAAGRAVSAQRAREVARSGVEPAAGQSGAGRRGRARRAKSPKASQPEARRAGRRRWDRGTGSRRRSMATSSTSAPSSTTPTPIAMKAAQQKRAGVDAAEAEARVELGVDGGIERGSGRCGGSWRLAVAGVLVGERDARAIGLDRVGVRVESERLREPRSRRRRHIALWSGRGPGRSGRSISRQVMVSELKWAA